MFFFGQKNFFPTIEPRYCAYPVFNRIRQAASLKTAQILSLKKDIKTIPERVKKTLSSSTSYIAIEGNWAGDNPHLVAFLEDIMEGQAIFVQTDYFENLVDKKSVVDGMKDASKSNTRWAVLEGLDPAIFRALRLGANKAGSVTARVSTCLAQPVLAVYETVDSIKNVMDLHHQKNWMVIDDDNYPKVLAMLACVKEHAQKNLGNAMSETLLGPRYFWEEWRRRNGDNPMHMRETFVQELYQSRKEGAAGWVAEMQKTVGTIFNPGLDCMNQLPAEERALLSKQITNFSKWRDWSYAYGYHAFVEKDQNMQERMLKLEKSLLEEYFGVYNPELVLHGMGAAKYDAAYEQFKKKRSMLIKYAAASAGVTLLFFMWDYPFSPLISLALRVGTYFVPEVLLSF